MAYRVGTIFGLSGFGFLSDSAPCPCHMQKTYGGHSCLEQRMHGDNEKLVSKRERCNRLD